MTRAGNSHSSSVLLSPLFAALRAEANKAAAIYKDKQSAVESQVMAIDKMNAIINALEREMIALKKQYESAVETRNYTGIQLIDRNDELCILYEKANIHDKTLGEGEKALRVMTEEIRSLKLSIGEVERQLHLAKVHYPETPLWAERILELQKQLVQARQVTEKLCASLEAPGAKDRWVELGGDDPDEDVLNERFSALEVRVNAAREELLEKELVLEEISTLTARLKAAASNAGGTASKTGPAGTTVDAPAVAAAKQATELQSKIKEVNRKMMAVVSELSMYQATAIKLAAESNTAGEALAKAEEAASKGLPPSVAAEQRWQSILKTMQQTSAGATSMQPSGSATTLLPDGVRTTAEVRPNAYIPEGIGLPKPYGEFAPFKPQLGGSQMRHFRPPEVKEIEI
jgi:chromosome segregation ATPase